MKQTTIALFSFAVILLFGACSTSKNLSYSPGGSWDLNVNDRPEGDVNSTMILRKLDDGYEGEMINASERCSMMNLSIKGNSLRCHFQSMGFFVILSGQFDKDVFTGIASVDGKKYPVIGRRMETDVPHQR